MVSGGVETERHGNHGALTTANSSPPPAAELMHSTCNKWQMW